MSQLLVFYFRYIRDKETEIYFLIDKIKLL